MPTSARHIVTILTVALAGCGLSGCGTINEKLAAGVSDAIPAAIGGIPADAPPRPGTAKYDEYMRERERKRLLPASERGEEAKPAPSSQDCDARSIHEHHGLAAVEDHAVLEVMAHGARQHAAFDVAALARRDLPACRGG